MTNCVQKTCKIISLSEIDKGRKTFEMDDEKQENRRGGGLGNRRPNRF